MNAAPALSVKLVTAPIERKITIQKAGSGKFQVRVEPRLDGEPTPEIYTTMQEARCYATGLQLGRGWPVSDQT